MDRTILEAARLREEGGEILLHDAVIDSVCAVEAINKAIRFWQEGIKNRLPPTDQNSTVS
jgi:hypothetical protein